MLQLYLHGLAQGDFELALRGLLGDGAPLSASSIERLRGKWVAEFAAWSRRSLRGLEPVYLWADGIYVKAGLEKDKAALLWFRFEPGSYGGLGAFMPSIACMRQVRSNEWEYHFLIVRPEDLHTEEEPAVAEATRDLDRAFASRSQSMGDVAIAQSLKSAGYVSVEDFHVVEI